MKFWEAMKALEEGKKIRGKGWAKDSYIYKDLDSDYLREENGIRWETFDVKHGFHEWELYEEPERTLSFMEIVAGMRKGKRFKRKAWGISILKTENNYVLDDLSEKIPFTIEDFEAKDWIEVKE